MDYEVVPEGLGHHLGHLGLGDICLGITGEMVHHYQDIFFLTLPWLQAQVIDLCQFQGMGSHDIFHGIPLLLCLKGDAPVALLNVLSDLYSHSKPKEMVMYEVEHSLETQVADLLMTPSQGGLPMHGQQDQLKLGLL